MQKYKDWLVNYFSPKADISKGFEDTNYFEAGVIDSFGVIELIEEIEKQFDIKFSQENFQDRRFSTVNGLAEIIREQKGS